MTYWSSVSLISCGVGTCVIASATSRSSSSARISLHKAMHSLQMYTDGPEMNFRTESFDFPQKEHRRCLSWDIGRQGLGNRCWIMTGGGAKGNRELRLDHLDPRKREGNPCGFPSFVSFAAKSYFVTASSFVGSTSA